MANTQALGQLFVFGFDGFVLPNKAKELLITHNAGGVILFKRNIDNLRQLVFLNQKLLTLKTEQAPLISVDEEGGRVSRLREICTQIPSARCMAEAAKDDPTLVYRLAAMLGRELVSLGFHLDFAPVADVDTNPENPVIGDRSFSNRVDEVSHWVREWISGMQGAGVATCAKHFPGHGDTSQDSHLTLPSVDHDMARLEALELQPFKAAISAQVASIMTAHIVVKKVEAKLPATLSVFFNRTVLREQLHFNGLLFSDDLDMKAITTNFALEETLLRGLHAGIDCFLICQDTDKCEAAIAFVHKLVDTHAIDPVLVTGALERMAHFKQRYIGAVCPPSIEVAMRTVRSKPHLALAALTPHNEALNP